MAVATPASEWLELFTLPPTTGDGGARFLETAARLFGADSGSLFVLDVAEGSFALWSQFGAGGPGEGARVVLGEGIAGTALAMGKAMRIEDPAEHPLLAGREIGRRADLASALVVPLRTPSTGPVGVLNLSRSAGQAPFDDRDLDQASAAGAYLALALDNLRLYEAQREAARLSRLAEIGQMTAAVAHEIRNPLAAIRGAAQMIQAAPEDALEFALMVDEEARKLNRLCDDFLEFARPPQLNTSPVFLDRLALQVASHEQAAFAELGTALVIETDGCEETVLADPLRIEQILRNLLRNAREAAGSGGEVVLHIHAYGFVVEDDGPGLPETGDRLFAPFFTTKPKGTGLGLSNVRKLVEAHAGRIWASNRPRGGARFEVLLPSGGRSRHAA